MEEGLKFLFNQGVPIRQIDGVIMGNGLFEKDLEEQGFTKKELRKLCDRGMLRKVITKFQGGWRNTYVLIGGDQA
jgi:hypothetical protein